MTNRAGGARGAAVGGLLALALGAALAGCQAGTEPAGVSVPPPATPGNAPIISAPPPPAIPTEAPFTGYLAPDFTLPDPDGKPISLHDYRGHPVWLNLWATWCVPCQTEMPEMAKLYARYQSQGLIILGVDVKEDAGRVRDFVTPRGFRWQFVLDGDGAVSRRYYLTGIPMHVFIDKTGAIRALQPGGLDTSMMEPLLKQILE
jgi:cytochrome c-type biogenesis protein